MQFLDALRPDRETAHTRLLGWFLNPAESHGLGAVVLQEFCRVVVPHPVPSRDLAKAIVRVEERLVESRIDVSIRFPRLLLFVENKIASGAFSADQIDRHRQMIGRTRQRIVLLCPVDGRNGEPVTWRTLDRRTCTVLSWDGVARILGRAIIRTRREGRRAPGLTFLCAYLDYVERRILHRWKGPDMERLNDRVIEAAAHYLPLQRDLDAQLRAYLAAVERFLTRLPKGARRHETRPYYERETGEIILGAIYYTFSKRRRTMADVWLYFYCDPTAKRLTDTGLYLSADFWGREALRKLRHRRLLSGDTHKSTFGSHASRWKDLGVGDDVWVCFGEEVSARWWRDGKQLEVGAERTAQRLNDYLEQVRRTIAVP